MLDSGEYNGQLYLTRRVSNRFMLALLLCILPRVSPQANNLRLGVLARLGTLGLVLWRCVLELHAILLGVVDGLLQLWANVALLTTWPIIVLATTPTAALVSG